jgi:hypothetical protein
MFSAWLFPYWAYCLTQMDVNFNQTKRYHVKGDSTVNRQSCENIKSTFIFALVKNYICRSQWPRNLRHKLFAAWTLGSCIRNPIEAWMYVCIYSVFVSSCVGSCVETGLIPIQGVLPSFYTIHNLLFIWFIIYNSLFSTCWIGFCGFFRMECDSHNLQITTAHAKSFPACSVFTRRFLVTASNNNYSSASVLKSSLKDYCLFLFQLSSSQPLSTDRVENTVSNSNFIVACVSVAAGTCLRSRCIQTALHVTILNEIYWIIY